MSALRLNTSLRKKRRACLNNRLSESLERLSETRIVTNIKTDGQQERQGFGLIDSWKIVQKDAGGRMIAIEIKISPKILELIKHENILLKDLY